MATPLKCSSKGRGRPDPLLSRQTHLPPPRRGCRPGGKTATTQDFTFFEPSVPGPSSYSGGGGPAAADPYSPVDRAMRAGSGSQAHPNRASHETAYTQSWARTWADTSSGNRTPPTTRGQGHTQAPRARTEAQRHRGVVARLKIASLNIKGRRSGDIKKWMHIPQIMRERKIGILAVQETHLTDELAQQFEDMFGNNLSLKFSPDPGTRNARGIALVLNKRLIKTDNVQETEIIPGQAIALKVPWHNDQDIKLLAIYTPNAPGEIREFWKSIQNKIDANQGLKPNIVLGDFNLVEDAIDRIPSKPDDHQTTESLREFKSRHDLVDGWRKANPEEKGYTWARDSDGTQSRIDRIYVHEDYFNECSRWDISPAPVPTDHDMVSVSIATPSSPQLGRGRWAIPPRLVKNRKMKKEIQKQAMNLQRAIENLGERTPRNNPQTLLKKFKTEVRETLCKHEKIMQPILKHKINKLTETLRETTNNTSLMEEEIKITTIHIKKEIQTLYRDMHDKN